MEAMQRSNHDEEIVGPAEQIAQLAAMVAGIGRGKRQPTTTVAGVPLLQQLPVGAADTRICSQCGTICHAREVVYGARMRLIWSMCACMDAIITHAEATRAAAQTLYQHYVERESRADTTLEEFDRQGMTLARFRSRDIELDENGTHPWDEMRAWLSRAFQRGADRSEHGDIAGALYLYSGTRGNGKTHAAVALLELAAAHGWPVAAIEEERFAQQCWGRDIEGQARLIARFAQMPGLLLIDDIGRREPSRGLRNLYDALISRRYAEGGWTVLTSNYTPAELLRDNAINESTFSRLGGLISRRFLTITGYDHRIESSR